MFKVYKIEPTTGLFMLHTVVHSKEAADFFAMAGHFVVEGG